jgi:hypothetical protein
VIPSLNSSSGHVVVVSLFLSILHSFFLSLFLVLISVYCPSYLLYLHNTERDHYIQTSKKHWVKTEAREGQCILTHLIALHSTDSSMSNHSANSTVSNFLNCSKKHTHCSPSRLPVERDERVCHILAPHACSVGDLGRSFGSKQAPSSEPEINES